MIFVLSNGELYNDFIFLRQPRRYSSVVEHFTRNEGVPGSSPGAAFYFFWHDQLSVGISISNQPVTAFHSIFHFFSILRRLLGQTIENPSPKCLPGMSPISDDWHRSNTIKNGKNFEKSITNGTTVELSPRATHNETFGQSTVIVKLLAPDRLRWAILCETIFELKYTMFLGFRKSWDLVRKWSRFSHEIKNLVISINLSISTNYYIW